MFRNTAQDTIYLYYKVLYRFRIVILSCSNYTIDLIIIMLHFRTAGNITNVAVPMCSTDPFNSANESFVEEK